MMTTMFTTLSSPSTKLLGPTPIKLTLASSPSTFQIYNSIEKNSIKPSVPSNKHKPSPSINSSPITSMKMRLNERNWILIFIIHLLCRSTAINPSLKSILVSSTIYKSMSKKIKMELSILVNGKIIKFMATES